MTNRQFSRNHRRKDKENNRHRIFILLAIVVVAVGGITYVGWAKRGTAQQAFTARVNTWWAERKARIAAKLAQSQEKDQLAVATKTKKKSSAPEPVHFEFYSMLPNNGVPAETESPPIFNHDNLEREFAKTVDKASYVIQTGLYNNVATADKTRASLAEDGLAAKVVKAYIDERLVYRVQVGPYQEKDQINDVQTKLAARGLHGVLRKTEEKLA